MRTKRKQKEVLYAGVDLHKKYSFITVMDRDGNIIEQTKVNTDDEETKDFFQKYSDYRLEIAFESTFNWYWFFDLIEKRSRSLYLSNPLKTKMIASAKIKTDKIDSKVIADLLRTNFLPIVYIPDKQTREYKELVRQQIFLTRQKTKLKNRIHSILHKHMVKHTFSDLFGKAGRKFLLELDLKEVFKDQIETDLQLIEFYEEKLEKLSQTISDRIKENPDPRIELLMSLPGIGKFSALAILSEIGDINRFSSAAKLCSYAGIVPAVYSSGGKTRSGRITKRGSSILRWIMIESVQRLFVSKVDSRLKIFCKKMARKRNYHVAKTATARKMLAIIYTMLKHGTYYENFPNTTSKQ